MEVLFRPMNSFNQEYFKKEKFPVVYYYAVHKMFDESRTYVVFSCALPARRTDWVAESVFTSSDGTLCTEYRFEICLSKKEFQKHGISKIRDSIEERFTSIAVAAQLIN